jgi:hypothetical protein
MRLTMLIRKIEYSTVNKSSTYFRFFPPEIRSWKWGATK